MEAKMLTVDSYVELTAHTLLLSYSDGEDWTTMVRNEIKNILQSESRAIEISLALFAEAEEICECVTAEEMNSILKWCSIARSLQALDPDTDGYQPPQKVSDFAHEAQGLYCLLKTLTETEQRYVLQTLGCPEIYIQSFPVFADELSIRIKDRCKAQLCSALSDDHEAALSDDHEEILESISKDVLGRLLDVKDLTRKIKDIVKKANPESLARVRSAVIDRLTLTLTPGEER